MKRALPSLPEFTEITLKGRLEFDLSTETLQTVFLREATAVQMP